MNTLSVRLDNIETIQLNTIKENYNKMHHTKLNTSDIIRVMISEYYQDYQKIIERDQKN